MSDETYRCPGFCCQAFNIGPPGEALRKRLEEVGDPDKDLILDMVIYLGKFPRNPAWPHDSDPPFDGDKTPAGDRGHFHTCKHYDRETRSCGIYDRRPGMCRRFPNTTACGFVGCNHPPVTKKRV